MMPDGIRQTRAAEVANAGVLAKAAGITAQ